MHSAHSLIRHRDTNSSVGAVRLILPNPSNPAYRLPIERHFGQSFDHSILRSFDFSRDEIGEVSRFAISKRSLQSTDSPRKIPTALSPVMAPAALNRIFAYVSFGLIATLFRASVDHKISYWYAAMEPSLSRLLARSGIVFTKIGPLMEYHGKRQPMIARVDDLRENIFKKCKEFYWLIDEMGGIGHLAEDGAWPPLPQQVPRELIRNQAIESR